MNWLCTACAVEYPDADDPPDRCPICEDERQYVPASGQGWTTLEHLSRVGGRVVLRELEPNLIGITAEPKVGIGQTSLLLRTPKGNLLWDPIGFVDEVGADLVSELGGADFVVASHPHMYGAQLSWAEFLDAKVLVAEADHGWLQRDGARIETFSGERELLPGVTLRTVGGHFPGSAVVHWVQGADGRGVVLAGDTVFPGPSGRWVSFLRSYPNQLPLSAAVVARVSTTITERQFDRMYGNFANAIASDARQVVSRSAERYIAWVSGQFDHLT
jgi:hypothetical protein